ncbi:MAG: hypothetical protein B5M51_07460 [Anaerolinea sp. 4484_236]|nr:MAG: hypothetical protein B5M51_07460 [Anaerolinea sp. 4484_236]
MNKQETNAIFGISSFWVMAILIAILVCGFAVRLFDLTDPPLDYAATRQLRAALIARGMYYKNNQTAPDWQREMAIAH